MARFLRTRTLPWFLLAGLLCVVALLLLHGTAQAAVFAAGVCVLLAASIRYVGLALRDDPVRAQIVSRDGLIGGVAGGISSMSAGESARRRRRKR